MASLTSGSSATASPALSTPSALAVKASIASTARCSVAGSKGPASAASTAAAPANSAVLAEAPSPPPSNFEAKSKIGLVLSATSLIVSPTSLTVSFSMKLPTAETQAPTLDAVPSAPAMPPAVIFLLLEAAARVIDSAPCRSVSPTGSAETSLVPAVWDSGAGSEVSLVPDTISIAEAPMKPENGFCPAIWSSSVPIGSSKKLKTFWTVSTQPSALPVARYSSPSMIGPMIGPCGNRSSQSKITFSRSQSFCSEIIGTEEL